MSHMKVTITEYRDDGSRKTLWSSKPILSNGLDLTVEPVVGRSIRATCGQTQEIVLLDSGVVLTASDPTPAQIAEILRHPLV